MLPIVLFIFKLLKIYIETFKHQNTKLNPIFIFVLNIYCLHCVLKLSKMNGNYKVFLTYQTFIHV